MIDILLTILYVYLAVGAFLFGALFFFFGSTPSPLQRMIGALFVGIGWGYFLYIVLSESDQRKEQREMAKDFDK